MGAPVRSKSGGPTRREALKKLFLVVPLHFLTLKAQLVVLVSAFVMVSTVWSVSCLLFYSRAPRAQPFVKVGGARVPRAPWSRRHYLHIDTPPGSGAGTINGWEREGPCWDPLQILQIPTRAGYD